MARIPDEVIERIKAAVSLERLAGRYGVELKKHGKDLVGRCPFHEDKTPSLVISPAKNVFHCFGCDAAGTPIDWVMKLDGLSFRHAVEVLEQDTAGGEPKPVKRTTRRKLDTLQADPRDRALLNTIGAEIYPQALPQTPDALAYLDKRGLNDRDLIEHFKLGAANRTLAYRLPEKQYQAGREVREQLQRIGILRESGHEHLNGSVVVPIFDAEGNVVQLYGRKFGANLRKGTPRHLYLPGEHRGVFNLDGFKDTDELIICEALFDALTVWQAGLHNVTSSFGVNGFTDPLLAALHDHGINRVLIAYDNDESGNAAAGKLAERLIGEGFECYRVNLPKDTDLNEYALQATPASESIPKLIRSAEWMGGAQRARQLETGSNRQQTTQQPEKPKAKAQFEQQLKDVSAQLNAMDAPASSEPLPAMSREGRYAGAPGGGAPAKAVPDAPQEIEAEVTDSGIHIAFGSRRYRIRGFEHNHSDRTMKINLLVRSGNGLHVDTFDMGHAKARKHFIRDAAEELDVDEQVIKADVDKLFLKLELMQVERLRQANQPEDGKVQLSESEHAEAMMLLKQPDLLSRIVHDIERAGLVGEQTNSLVGYLACLSRKLKRPLGVLVQSTSAAGKSSLMDAVLALMPIEEREQYSAMTGQSLFYMGETSLKHKILAIAEEEGAAQASYALKLLQSEGKLSIASTAKDPQTGRLETEPYHVEGPVMLFLTSTAIDIDDELMNRCLVLSVNESREQTRAIHERQRFECTLEGILAETEHEDIARVHQNAQRLIRPLKVVNPYARHLRFADDKTRTRRDQRKYITLIESIALLHQHQRTIHTGERNGKTVEYVEVELSDIEIANRLAHEVLGRTLDELPPQTRTLLNRIHDMVREQCRVEGIEQSDYRFSRRQVREMTGWSHTALKVHLARLVDLEYLLVHGRGQRHFYELLYQGEGDEQDRFTMGLIDIDRLKHEYDTNRSGVEANRSGQKANRSGPGQGVVSPRSGGGQGRQNGKKQNGSDTYEKTTKKPPKSTAPGSEKTNGSRTVVVGSGRS